MTRNCEHIGGAKILLGLFSVLRAAKGLEGLSIAVDTASVARSSVVESSGISHISNLVCMQKFSHLGFFELRGFEFHSAAIMMFLSNHKHSLSGLRFADCNLIGSWTEVFSGMCDSTVMQRLRLCQLGQNWCRVGFPNTYLTHTTDVTSLQAHRGWHAVAILPHQEWRRSLDAIIQDLTVTNTMVDSSAADALYWV
jgi:hypothetical protein